MTEARQQRVMDTYKCSADNAQRLIDLRDAGHSIYEIKPMNATSVGQQGDSDFAFSLLVSLKPLPKNTKVLSIQESLHKVTKAYV